MSSHPGADIVVDAPVDPDNITISAADDITINSHIAANRLVKISAGDDGTGDLLTTTASLIEAGGTAANGDMTLSAGNTSGEIRLNGTVRATDSLTVSALGGSINGSSNSPLDSSRCAATGIGNTAPLRLNAGTVSAESLNGDISLTSNTAAVYSTVSTGTGSVTLRSNASAEIHRITSQEGNIAVIGESAPDFP